MSKGRQVSVQIQQEVTRLVREGFEPAQIARELERKQWLGSDPVSSRTLQRMVRDLRPTDDSGPWSLAEADADQARLILDVLSYAIGSMSGARAWPSADLARWIAHVKAAAPGVPASWAYGLAWAYQTRQAEDTRLLDMALALRPWASESDLEWFVHLVQCSRETLGPPDALRQALLELVSDEVLMRLDQPGDKCGRRFRVWT